MSRIGLLDDGVVYPTSDGQPMAETEVHGECMMYVASALRWWFRKHGRDDVHVGSNNFLYYERGNPRAVVSPDVYVVVGAPAGLRDTYMLWNEPKGPDLVLEVTSDSTRRTDERRKRDIYAELGVREYFLYDPRAEYLVPPLQGWRLHEGEYGVMPAVTMLSNRGVAVASEVLGLELRDAGGGGSPLSGTDATTSRSSVPASPSASACPAGSPRSTANRPVSREHLPPNRRTNPAASATSRDRDRW